MNENFENFVASSICKRDENAASFKLYLENHHKLVDVNQVDFLKDTKEIKELNASARILKAEIDFLNEN